MCDVHAACLRPRSRRYVPTLVPAMPAVRLLEEDPCFVSYGEAYDVSCMR